MNDPIDPVPGDTPDTARMFQLVYDELRSLARRLRGGGSPAETLEPTGLVHEAFLRVVHAPALNWTSEAHFKAIAAQAMRRILIDRTRRRLADKRGGHRDRVTLSGLPDCAGGRDVAVVEQVLSELETLDPRMARLVEMRVFGGMTHEEIGIELGLAERTVRKEWRTARAWLLTRLPVPR